MPPQTAKSNLLAKLNSRAKSFEAHANDETEYGNVQLPAGIENGIAQLVECKFDTYKKGDHTGEIYFLATGIVKTPVEFTDDKGNLHRTEGQRTTIGPKMLSKDVPNGKTADENIAWCQNELRKLGADPGGLGLDKIESTMLALKQTQPFFKFRTWKGSVATEGPYKGKEPLTNHQWNGACEYEGSADDGVVDATPAAGTTPSTNGDVYTDQSPLDTANLDDLLARANDQDGEAQDELERLAIEAGKTKKDVDDSTSWDQVVEWIKEANGGGGEGEDNADWAPAKDENYKYILKDGKRSKKVEVEVLTVNATNRTVTLKNLDTGKPIMDGKRAAAVPWDDLMGYDN